MNNELAVIENAIIELKDIELRKNAKANFEHRVIDHDSHTIEDAYVRDGDAYHNADIQDTIKNKQSTHRGRN